MALPPLPALEGLVSHTFAIYLGKEVVYLPADSTPIDVAVAVNRQTSWTAILVWGSVVIEATEAKGDGT